MAENMAYDVNKAFEVTRLINEAIINIGETKDVDAAISKSLTALGELLDADRTFIFEKKGDAFSNTFEWCGREARPKIADFQNIPVSCFAPLMASFTINEPAAANGVDMSRPYDPLLSSLLYKYNIDNFTAAPIMSEGTLLGFIGADNADEDYLPYLPEAFKVYGTFIGSIFGSRGTVCSSTVSAVCGTNGLLYGQAGCAIIACRVSDLETVSSNVEARKIVGLGEKDNVSNIIERIAWLIADISERDAFIDCVMSAENVRQLVRVTRDGTERYFSVTAKPLEVSGDKLILVTMCDVTEEKVRGDLLDRKCISYRDAISKGSEYSFAFDLTDAMVYEDFTTAHGVNIAEIMGVTFPVKFDELIGKYTAAANLEFLSEETAEHFTVEGLLRAYERGETNVVSEYYSPRTNIFTRVNTLMYHDEKTGHIRAFASAFDITDAILRERDKKRELQRANERLSKLNSDMSNRIDVLMEGLSGGLRMGEFKDGEFRLTYISEGAAQIMGYSVEEYRRRFGMDHKAGMIGDVDKYMAIARSQGRNTNEYEIKYPVRHKDGSVRWVMDRGKCVEVCEDGRKRYNILVQDITESERQSEAINDLLTMQKHMVEFLGIGIFAYTIPDRKILAVNQEAARIFDISTKDSYASGVDVMRRIIPEDTAAVRDAVSKLKKTGDSAEYIFHSVKKDGRLEGYRCNTKLLSFSSGQQYIISAINEITVQEEMEQRINEERRTYRNALELGCTVFFTIDLSDGILREQIMSRDDSNNFADLGLVPPVYYDDIARAWIENNEVMEKNDVTETVRSRKSLISAYKRGNRVIEIEYIHKKSGRKYRGIVMLFKYGESIHASFAAFDIK